MFGIKHCVYYNCVMNGSSYGNKRFQDMIDKSFDMCPICLRKLQLNMGFDFEERFKKLYAFCEEQGAVYEKDTEFYENALAAIDEAYKFIKK